MIQKLKNWFVILKKCKEYVWKSKGLKIDFIKIRAIRIRFEIARRRTLLGEFLRLERERKEEENRR